jgi:hypothetical protein
MLGGSAGVVGEASTNERCNMLIKGCFAGMCDLGKRGTLWYFGSHK